VASQQQFARKGQLYRQLDKILSAMKAFAYAEVRKLEGQMESHQALLGRYRGVIQRLLHLGGMLPETEPVPLVIVIGTERGFCGDINRRLATGVRQDYAGRAADIVLLGSRLATLFDQDVEPESSIQREGQGGSGETRESKPRPGAKENEGHTGQPVAKSPVVVASLRGASSAEDVEPLVEKLMEKLLQLDRRNPLLNTSMLFFDDKSDSVQTLPLFEGNQRRDPGPGHSGTGPAGQSSATGDQGLVNDSTHPPGGSPRHGHDIPLMYQDPGSLLQSLVPEYVFSVIHYGVRAALLSENRSRLSHMDTATRHLDEISQRLTIKASQLRQETIINEIEAHVATEALTETGLQTGQSEPGLDN